MPRDPETREEWQVATDAAQGALALDAARRYGLVTGGPDVNVERCLEVIASARRLGIRPAADAVEAFAAALASTAARV